MAKASLEDPRLVRLTKICLELPEVTRWYNGQHAGFQVRKKNFAWFLSADDESEDEFKERRKSHFDSVKNKYLKLAKEKQLKFDSVQKSDNRNI